MNQTLSDLGNFIYSTRGNPVMVIIYDVTKNKDILSGCTIEHAISIYGYKKVKVSYPQNNNLIIEVEGK